MSEPGMVPEGVLGALEAALAAVRGGKPSESDPLLAANIYAALAKRGYAVTARVPTRTAWKKPHEMARSLK